MKLSKNDQLVFNFLAKELDTKDSKLLPNKSIMEHTGIKYASSLRRTLERLVKKELLIKNENQNFNTYKLTEKGKQLAAIKSKPILELPVVDEDKTYYNLQIRLIYNYIQDLTKRNTVRKLDLIPLNQRNLIEEILRNNDREDILNVIDFKYMEWKDNMHYNKNLAAKTLFKPDLFYKYKQQLEHKKKYEGYQTKRYLPKPVSELSSEIVNTQQGLLGANDSLIYPKCVKLYNLGFRRWKFFNGNIFTQEYREKFMNEYYPNGKPEKEAHLFTTRRNNNR